MGKLEIRNWLGEAAGALRQIGRPEGAAAGAAEALLREYRRELRDDLFGRGYLLPGGEAEVLRLARPLHLTHAARLLVVGAGTCGPAETLARQLGLYVHGFDRLGVVAGGAGRAELSGWEPGRESLPAAEFHHGLALHPLQDGAPEPVLAQIVGALRPGGNLIVVEHVATEGFDANEESAAAWLAHEGRAAAPPEAQDLERALARLGMQVRDSEDLSPLHARLTVYDWRRLVERMREPPSGDRAAVMMAEAAGWARRGRLFEAGALRLMRWHAVLTCGGAGKVGDAKAGEMKAGEVKAGEGRLN